MENDDYIKSLKNGTVTKADFEYAKSVSTNLVEFDPHVLAEEPAHVSFTAQTKSGKTYLIIDWLSKIHKKFDRIYMVSNTAKAQKIYDCIPRENIQDTFDEVFFIELYEEAYELSKGKKKLPKTLIIFDDIVNDSNYRKSGADTIDRYFTNGRQYNFSIWFLNQSFSLLNTTRRLNVMYAVAFDIESYRERDKFVEAYVSAINNRTGHIIFKSVVKEAPYQCIIIDRTKPGSSIDKKIKKYIAKETAPFKIKSVGSGKYNSRKYSPGNIMSMSVFEDDD